MILTIEINVLLEKKSSHTVKLGKKWNIYIWTRYLTRLIWYVCILDIQSFSKSFVSLFYGAVGGTL